MYIHEKATLSGIKKTVWHSIYSEPHLRERAESGLSRGKGRNTGRLPAHAGKSPGPFGARTHPTKPPSSAAAGRMTAGAANEAMFLRKRSVPDRDLPKPQICPRSCTNRGFPVWRSAMRPPRRATATGCGSLRLQCGRGPDELGREGRPGPFRMRILRPGHSDEPPGTGSRRSRQRVVTPSSPTPYVSGPLVSNGVSRR